jgi:hypothetical protein
MKRHVLICGILGGVLITVLQWTQYQFLILQHSLEIYGAIVAAIFAGLGIWLGLKLTARPATVVIREVPTAPTAPTPFVPDDARRDGLGITRRELEILELVAQGSATARSPASSSSARTPSRPTAAAPSTSSEPGAAPKPSSSAKNLASSPEIHLPVSPKRMISSAKGQNHPKE